MKKKIEWEAIGVILVLVIAVALIGWATSNAQTCRAAGYDAVETMGFQAYCVGVRDDGVLVYRLVEDVRDGPRRVFP